MFEKRIHNVFDYVFGTLLLLAPFDFGFVSVDPARNVFVLAGSVWILYSLFTNYEYAVLRVLPLKVHLGFDLLVAGILASAPDLFSYREQLTPALARLHVIAGGVVLLHALPVIVGSIWRRIKSIGPDRNWSTPDLARPLTPSSPGR